MLTGTIKREPQAQRAENDRKEAAITAARLILASSQTAPIAGGVAGTEGIIIHDDGEIETLAYKMEELSKRNKSWDFFRAEAVMIRDSDAIVVLGNYMAVKDVFELPQPCGMCGFASCQDCRDAQHLDPQEERAVAFGGPMCQIRLNSLGHQLAGGVTAARELGVDHTIMWSAGFAAMELKLLPLSVCIAVAIPIAVFEKNPYLDVNLETYAERNWRTLSHRTVNRLYPIFRSIYS